MKVNGKKLREERERRGYSQTFVGGLFNISQRYVSQIENGDRNLHEKNFEKVRKVFGDVVFQEADSDKDELKRTIEIIMSVSGLEPDFKEDFFDCFGANEFGLFLEGLKKYFKLSENCFLLSSFNFNHYSCPSDALKFLLAHEMVLRGDDG